MPALFSSEKYAVFRNRTFTCTTLVIALMSMVKLVRTMLVGWYVYEQTGNLVHLGTVAFAEGGAYLIVSPLGGYLADRFGRKRQSVILISLSIILTGLLCYLVSQPLEDHLLFLLHVCLVGFGLTRGLFGSGAMNSLIALVIPRHQFHFANAWNGALTQFMYLVSPVVAGIIYKHAGPLVANASLFVPIMISLVLMGFIRDVPVKIRDNVISVWQDMTAGFRFVFGHNLLSATVAMDLVVVIFSGVTGLLPAFAKDILHVGPDGLGYLRCAIQLGSFIAGFALAHHHLTGRVGRQYMILALLFCACTLAFALSTSFYLSLGLLFLSGFFDWYGTIIRQSFMRLLTPEELLGRVTSARVFFAGASNEISAFESGLVAGWIGTVPSVVVGVVITASFAAWVWWRKPLLRSITHEQLVEND